MQPTKPLEIRTSDVVELADRNSYSTTFLILTYFFQLIKIKFVSTLSKHKMFRLFGQPIDLKYVEIFSYLVAETKD
jgi:hypothetical protein